jgi:hypothetical protein
LKLTRHPHLFSTTSSRPCLAQLLSGPSLRAPPPRPPPRHRDLPAWQPLRVQALAFVACSCSCHLLVSHCLDLNCAHQAFAACADGDYQPSLAVHSRDMISPRPSPASGRNSRPRRIHASPEGLLKQRAHLRLARGPARAGFAVKQPWPDRLANRPYRRSIQCKDRLTPYPDARSSIGRANVTAVTSPLH